MMRTTSDAKELLLTILANILFFASQCFAIKLNFLT